MSNMVRSLTVAAALLCSCLLAQVDGKRVWVSGDGLPSEPCGNVSSPCSNIQHAYAQTLPGDDILFQPTQVPVVVTSTVEIRQNLRMYSAGAPDCEFADPRSKCQLRAAILFNDSAHYIHFKNASFVMAHLNIMASKGTAIRFSGGVPDDTIQHSIINCTVIGALHQISTGNAIVLKYDHLKLAKLSLMRSSFENGTAGLVVSTTASFLRVGIHDCVFLNAVEPAQSATSAGAFQLRSYTTRDTTFVDVLRSKFINGLADMGGGFCYWYFRQPQSTDFKFTDCEFDNNFSSIGGALAFLSLTQGPEFTSTAIKLHIVDCQFTRNTVIDGQGGAIAFNGPPDQITVANGRVIQSLFGSTLTIEGTNFIDNKCVKDSSQCVGAGIFMSRGDIEMRDVSFIKNTGSFAGGALYMLAGCNVELTNVRFHGNVAEQGAAIYLSQTLFVSLTNTSVHLVTNSGESRQPSLYLDRVTALTIDSHSDIVCTRGSTLDIHLFERITSFSVLYNSLLTDSTFFASCLACPTGKFSVTGGSTKGGDSPGAMVHSAFLSTCQKCPFGASCDGHDRVQVHAHLWPTAVPSTDPTSSPDLALYGCPTGYCGDRTHNLSEPCRSKRAGRLCGECSPGTSQAIGSPACVENTDCTDGLLYFVLLFLLIFVYIMYLLFTQRKGAMAIAKITLYFYQVVGLVVTDQLQTFTSLFRVQLSFSEGAGLCPFSSFTTVQALLFNYVSPCIAVGVLTVVTVFIRRRRSQLQPVRSPTTARGDLSLKLLADSSVESQDSDEPRCRTDNHKHCNSVVQRLFSRQATVRVAWTRFILTIYSSVLGTTVQLLHCVEIEGDLYLFRAATLSCYQPFQVFLLIVLGVLCCLPVVMFLSLRLRCSETSFGYMWVETLSAPYRPGSRWWESALIAYILIMTMCATFITNLTQRILILATVTLFALLAHVLLSPFKEVLMNALQNLFLCCVLLLCLVQSPKQVIISSSGSQEQYDRLGAVSALTTFLCLFPLFVCAALYLYNWWRTRAQV